MNDKFIKILKDEVVHAVGCTEPVAVSFVVAKATQILGKLPDSIVLTLSGNMLKNAMSVGVPGTGMKGVDIAVALGAIIAKPDLGMEILSMVNPTDLEKAKNILSNSNFLTKQLFTGLNKLYIKAEVISGTDKASVEVKNQHTNITLIEKNGKVLEQTEADDGCGCAKTNKSDMSVKSIVEFVETVDVKDIAFLEEIIKINMAVAEEGLTGDYGLKVGKTRLKYFSHTDNPKDYESHAIGYTAAAVDARMDGTMLPVMTNSGSGNQGITATVPVIVVAKRLGVSHEKLLRALALSSLVAIHIKCNLGRLSALCGCVVATTGAGCGITYLNGGGVNEISGTIKNVFGNISGMFCDGAKPGCALKVATGVSAAIQGSCLAIDKMITASDNGIVDEDVEKTINNACLLGKEAMAEVDKAILKIMINK